MRSTTRSLLAALLATAPVLVLAGPNCPPLGPVFEAPLNFRTSPYLRSALANITEALLVRDQDNSPAVRANETSYSIEIFSSSAADPLVFDWHHTARALRLREANATGVREVTADTVYRLGSLTKVHTVYTWLAQDGDARWNDPITKYVPELAEAVARLGKGDPVANVPWDEVTIGSLASQMSGAIRDYGVLGEITQQYNQSTMVGLGFPPLNNSDPTLPKCGVYPLCNRTEFFSGLLQAAPSFAPFASPAYTNTGFQLMAYALEAIKGKSFESMMQESLFGPLGLKHTYFANAPASEGIIPTTRQDSSWDFQLGDENAAGNIYSSPRDLSTLGRSILRSTLLPPSLTRRWLKPASLTSEPIASIGYPWGIRRINLPLANGKHPIDSYNKAGRIGHYSALLTLLPDYGIGFSIMIAGANIPGNTNFALADLMGAQLLPALEAAAREQAYERYGGEYLDEATSSYLRVTAQADRPGLGIENWVANGTDMQLVSVVLVAGYQGVTPSIRLYPTGLETVRADGSRRVAYKAVFEDLNLPARPNDMFSTDCGSWVSFTSVTYGTHALDQWVFEIDKAGKVVSLESLAMRSVLKRKAS